MAVKNENVMSGEWLNEKVKLTLPKSKLERDDVFVAVNGKAWQIKRGVEVEVPRYVTLALADSARQDEAALSFCESQSSQYMKNSK